MRIWLSSRGIQAANAIASEEFPIHVHLAVRLSRTVTPAKLIMELKTGSSRWLKSQGPKLTTFAWQRGYGAFSVGPTNLEALRKYIEIQEEHHQHQTFQDEYRGFLKLCGIDYDERYVWDSKGGTDGLASLW